MKVVFTLVLYNNPLYEIKPLINEYYFDKPDQASELIDTLYD